MENSEKIYLNKLHGPPYSCDKCGQLFTYPSGLRHHMKNCYLRLSLPLKEIPFVDCGETIKVEIQEESEIKNEIDPLNDPLNVKNDVNDMKVTAKTFPCNNKLNNHKTIIREQSFQCEICKKLHSAKDKLSKHLSIGDVICTSQLSTEP